VREIGRVEWVPADYGSTAYMDRSDATASDYGSAGRNSLAAEQEVSRDERPKKEFPRASITNHLRSRPSSPNRSEVVITIFIAILLVLACVFLFLQNWRASIIR